MLAYISNFVKSLSLTFLTQPPHFCKAIYDGGKKKTKKQTIPTLHTCHALFCFTQGGGQDGEQTLHLHIVFWSNDLLYIRLKFVAPFCHSV